jgi:hypothetical protein
MFLIFQIPPPPLVPRLYLLYKKVGKLRAPGFITESNMNRKRPLLSNKRQSLLKRIPRQSLGTRGQGHVRQ